MYQSDNDRKAEAIRDAAREDLIGMYEQQAALASETEFAFLNIRGQEVPDATVLDPPLGYVPQPDLMELMRRMIRTELSGVAAAAEFETEEEANDFDIEDDPVDYSSPYEEYFDPAPGQPPGPPGQIHPLKQDPNSPPPEPQRDDERGGGGGGAPKRPSRTQRLLIAPQPPSAGAVCVGDLKTKGVSPHVWEVEDLPARQARRSCQITEPRFRVPAYPYLSCIG